MNKDKLLTVHEIKEAIDTRLDTYLRLREKEATSIDKEYGELIAQIRIFILRGGKRMRPYLAYLSYVGSGGKDINEFLDVAISLELFHNYLLIHDDIIDRDFRRYGGLNIAGTYQRKFGSWIDKKEANHLGGGVALLAGDIDAVLCMDVILDSEFNEVIKFALIRELNRILFIEGGGQYLDMLTPHREVDENYLEKIYDFKSAVYSIEMPLRFGSLIAENKSIDYTVYSKPIGLAFQLVDDLLGMFGDEKTIGKPTISDLHEGKKTVLMIKALELSDAKQKATLQKLLGDKKAEYSDLEVVRQILIDTGARKYVQDKAEENLQLALKTLHSIDLSDEVIEAIKQLSSFIINRKS